MIVVMGHLGADAETRFTPSGQKVTTLRVAYKVHRGGKDTTIWYRITIWGDRFDKMLPYLKKGGAVVVTGEITAVNPYIDKAGLPQATVEVTADNLKFSPFGKPGAENQTSNYSGSAPQQAQGDYSSNSYGDNDAAFGFAPQNGEPSFAGAPAGSSSFGQAQRQMPSFDDEKPPF